MLIPSEVHMATSLPRAGVEGCDEHSGSVRAEAAQSRDERGWGSGTSAGSRGCRGQFRAACWP